MFTINVSLPDDLRAFIDEQVERRGFRSGGEYVRHLIHEDQERQHLRGLLLGGAESSPSAKANAAFFATLRRRIGA